MAKVLLIQPYGNPKDKNPNDSNLPLSLIYVGTAVEDKHTVQIFDRNVEDRDLEEFLKEYKPDIVGLPSWTSGLLVDVIYVGKLVKKILPSCTVVVGGVHATVEPESLLAEPYVDYIIRGEADEAFLEFCDTHDKNPKELPNLLNINRNPVRPFIDINTLKTPNYDLVKVSRYNRIYVNLSRGCPGDCTFCYNAPMWGINKPGSEKITENNPFVRVLKTEKMIDIFKMIIEKHKINHFSIIDDNFIFFKKRVLEVMKYLTRYKDLNFFCESRADTITDEICAALKKAGCHYVQIGIETGSQRMLDFLNKETTVQRNIDAVRCLQRHDIFSDTSIMIGIPTETPEDLKHTVDFVKLVKPDHPNIKFYMLWPSKLLDDCVDKGWVEKPKTLEEWSTWIGGTRSLGYNYSGIPNELLVKTAYDLWSYRLYQRKLKALRFQLKKGDVTVRKVVNGFRKSLYVRNQLKIPFIGTIRVKQNSKPHSIYNVPKEKESETDFRQKMIEQTMNSSV